MIQCCLYKMLLLFNEKVLVLDVLAALEQKIQSMMYRSEDRVWNCSICSKRSKSKTDVTRHIEASHLEDHPGFNCEVCGEVVKSRNALRQHRSMKHTGYSY